MLFFIIVDIVQRCFATLKLTLPKPFIVEHCFHALYTMPRALIFGM